MALSKRVLDAAEPQATEYFLWCPALPGFGARIYPTGRKVFVAQVRVGRRTRRIKIGGFGAFTVEQARERATAIIRAASDGRDPQREKQEARDALTVSELCERYIEAARAGLVMTRFKRPKRASTLAIDEGRISRHIVPLIGTVRASEVERSDAQRMADSIASGKTAGIFKGRTRGRAVVMGGTGTAARVVELLGGIYSWAEKRALVAGPNPVRGVETARGEPKERVLSRDELQRLGSALRRHQDQYPGVVAALRLIALTGVRRGEACELRWKEIDEAGQCLRLESTKTGRSTRPIGRKAVELLRSLPQADGVEWVFPRSDHKGPADMGHAFATLFDAAGLRDARSKALRRTFASVAADLGFGDATIAELLGHARRGVTARHYIRRPDTALIAAANKAAARIAGALSAPSAAPLM
jgi:integrase